MKKNDFYGWGCYKIIFTAKYPECTNQICVFYALRSFL